MWTYKQLTGEITNPSGVVLKPNSYSGYGKYRNDPTAQMVKALGPIPCGDYTITPEYTHPHLGPVVMNLDPYPENNMFGRSLFRIHGVSADKPATPEDESLLSSHGCICAVKTVRKIISASKDRLLRVAA